MDKQDAKAVEQTKPETQSTAAQSDVENNSNNVTAAQASTATATQQPMKSSQSASEQQPLSSKPSSVTLAPGSVVDNAAMDEVRATLGEQIAQLYALGTRLRETTDASGNSLEQATSKFVTALQRVPEQQTRSAAFGELLLAYGQALLAFVVRNGAAAGVLGGDVEREVKKGKADEGVQDDADGEEDIGEEEEEDDEELTWTQLELARVVFSNLGEKYVERLAQVHGTLGELLLESDQSVQAGAEFAKAAEIGSGRRKAEWLYKKYLALRRDEPTQALEAIRESERVFRQVGGDDEDVLKEIGEEAVGFEKAIGAVLKRAEAEAGGGEGGVKVVKVVPRKRTSSGDEMKEVKRARMND